MLNRQEYPSLRQGLVFAWKGDSASTVMIDEARRSRGVWNGTNPTTQFGASTFDGVANSITITESTGLSGNVPITVSAWVRPTISSFGILRFAGGSAGLRSLFGSFNVFGDSASLMGPASNTTVVLNAWQHCCYTYPGTQYEDILWYLNGAGPATVARQNGTANSGMNWVAGGASHIGMNNSTSYMAGQIADVRIYRRVLTLAEIRLLASRRGIGLTPLADRTAGLPRKLYVNVGGTWRSGDAYVNTGSGWRLGIPSVNVGGTWK